MTKFLSSVYAVFHGEDAEKAHETPAFMQGYDPELDIIICYEGSLAALAVCARIRKFRKFRIQRLSDGVTLMCGVDGIPRHAKNTVGA